MSCAQFIVNREQVNHGASLGAVFCGLCCHRGLWWRLVRPDVAGCYRGSLFGSTRAFLNPLLMVTPYTVVFGHFIKTRLQFSVVLFVGLIVFNLFTECVNRTSALIRQHLNYAKKGGLSARVTSVDSRGDGSVSCRDPRFAESEAFAESECLMDQPVKTYSSGTYVRFAFSVAIHLNPQILIVDEALAVGDFRFQTKCLNRVKAMQARGVMILFVTHDIGAVRTLGERALWLHKGRVRMRGDAVSVTTQYYQFLFEAESNSGNTSLLRDAEPGSKSHVEVTEQTAQTSASDPTPATESQRALLKHRPINHWSSHVGAILDSGIFSAAGDRSSMLSELEPISVRVALRAPPLADRSHMSVAFSFKDLRGSDLVVSTTWDQGTVHFTQLEKCIRVRFNTISRMNAGDYLLAVALKNHPDERPCYFEYVEGAQYFKSLTEHKRYGIFLVDIEQDIATT